MVHERALVHSPYTLRIIGWMVAAGAFFAALCTVPLFGETPDERVPQDRRRLYEPIYRISKTTKDAVGERSLTPAPEANEVAERPIAELAKSHPLDPALAMARESLDHIEQHVMDYTCMLVKRERVNGELLDPEYMRCKIRHPRKDEGRAIPFSVYMAFVSPDSMRGREVIYVEGYNDGKLIAHEGGLKGKFLPTVPLLPTSALALRGNRYPITEIGILTLTRRLIEKGERDRQLGECKVRLVDGALVNKRPCTMLEVLHPVHDSQLDFHLARVFMDKELKMPVRYEAYGWPESKGAKPPLLEEYTYMDVKVNVGLVDQDFDPANPNYRF